MVMALAVISIKAMPGVSGRFNHAVTETTGILEQARQYAVAQNTYVWVLFAPDSTADSTNLNIAVVASKDGLDPAAGAASYNYGTAPSASLELINSAVTQPQIIMREAGQFTAAKIPTLPSIASASNSVASGPYEFMVQIPRQTGATKFTQAIQFTPTGQVRNGPGVVDLVEFGLQPLKGAKVTDEDNIAVIRINGLTGQSRVYRP